MYCYLYRVMTLAGAAARLAAVMGRSLHMYRDVTFRVPHLWLGLGTSAPDSKRLCRSLLALFGGDASPVLSAKLRDVIELAPEGLTLSDTECKRLSAICDLGAGDGEQKAMWPRKPAEKCVKVKSGRILTNVVEKIN